MQTFMTILLQETVQPMKNKPVYIVVNQFWMEKKKLDTQKPEELLKNKNTFITLYGI